MMFGMLVAISRPRQGPAAEIAPLVLPPPARGAASAATLAHRWVEVASRLATVSAR